MTSLFQRLRTLWTWTFLEAFAQDAGYSLRALRRSPGFAAVAIVTLGLGIGLNTAIFGVINAVILRPLPYRDPATLVLVDTKPLNLAPDWLTAAWRERARTLRDLAGFNGPRAATLVAGGEPRQIDAADVTWNFLSLLGVAPIVGRDFTATDADRGAPAVAILSHELWRSAFGGDQDVVGKTVTLTGNPVTIVGVAAEGFRFPTGSAPSATRLPTDTQPDILRIASADTSVKVIGRLAPGSSPMSATGELEAIFKQEAGTRFRAGAVDDQWTLKASLLQDSLVGNVGQRLWLVMGAVSLVLLVACTNVASLVLARASTRQRELALRMALGARRSRVAGLVLTESLLLAFLASAVGLLFGYATSGVARALLADRIPHVDAIAIDLRVLVFNIVVAAATGMLCAVASLPDVRRLSGAAMFASGAAAVTGRQRIRRVLLSAETALTFVLVIGAALFVQTLWNLSAAEQGFDADRLLTVRVAAPSVPVDVDRSERSQFFTLFFTDLRDRLERIPGVLSAGAVSLGPLEGFSSGLNSIAVNGRKLSTEGSVIPVAFVTPGYFQTLRIPVVRGRDFNQADQLGAGLVAIVNEAFQRRFVPTGDIIGARVTSGGGPEAFTIVGVSQDVPDRSLRQAPEPLLTASLAQMPAVHISWSALTFVLRTADDDPLRLASEMRRAIWAVDPNIVIGEIATMDARVSVAMRTERDSAVLFGLFAVVALVMAAIGVYGVAAYTIAQRTKEIGIRIALGAARHDVRRLIVSHTLWPTLIGIAVGVAAAAMLTRLVASAVYGVTPLDPATFAVGVVVLVTVALAATWMPARRAIRIDPVVALRHE